MMSVGLYGGGRLGGLFNESGSNSCFLNAALQSLFHTPAFVNFLESDEDHRKICDNGTCVPCSLFRLLISLRSGTAKLAYSISLMLDKICPHMVRGRQEDASQFLQFLLDFIDVDYLMRPNYPPTTPIVEIFTGELQTTVVCCNCAHYHSSVQPERHLFIAAKNKSDAPESIAQKVNQYLDNVETINFKCDECCVLGPCIKRYSFWKYPKVLTVTLKRFEFGNDKKITDPIMIDKIMKVGQVEYELCSFIVHHGESVSSGHFTCVVQCPDKSFAEFNDDKVQTVSKLNAQSHLVGGYTFIYSEKIAVPDEPSQKEVEIKPLPTCKRPLPNTPSKVSPYAKKMHSFAKTFSPGRRKKSIRRSLLLCNNLPTDNKQALDKETKVVDKKFSSSIKCPSLLTCSPATAPLAVPEIQIVHIEKAWDSSDDEIVTEVPLGENNEFDTDTKRAVSETTKNACVTSLKLPQSALQQNHNDQVKVLLDDDDGVKAIDWNSDTEETMAACVTPQTVKFVTSTPVRHEDHTYCNIERQLKNDMTQNTETKKNAVVTPIKLKVKKVKKKKVDNISMYCNEDAIVQQKKNDITKDKNILNEQQSLSPIFQPDSEAQVLYDVGNPLTEDDVPESKLKHPQIEKNNVVILKNWLKWRGLGVGGRKKDLVERVKACISMQKDKLLDPKADQGRAYEAKKQKLASGKPKKSFPHSGWDIFPSQDIPPHFNFGSIFVYLIETMPAIPDSDNDCDSSGDEEDVQISVASDPFENYENEEIRNSKKMRRGLTYVKSKFVGNVKDCIYERVHYFKAQVRASMKLAAYTVKVAISQISGMVLRCECDSLCAARALGRCSHVSALLLQILLHVKLHGPGAITCTGRPCTWNQGSLKRDPSDASVRQYDSFKIDVNRRSTFDPRPMKYQSNYPAQNDINSFLAALSYKTTHWSLLWDMVYEDFMYDDNEMERFRELRIGLYTALVALMDQTKPTPQHTGPFELKKTRGQGESDLWDRLRCLHSTASTCRTVCHLRTDAGRMNHLLRCMWKVDAVQTRAMKYGISSEEKARQCYLNWRKTTDSTVSVQEVGLFLNTHYPGLSCSPDGIVFSSKEPPKLLEIKCPYILKSKNPRNFEENLGTKQKSRFCLKRNGSEISLKIHHNYYDQIQMCMGMLNLSACDFFVWSKEGFVAVTVPFDAKRWDTIRRTLLKFHHEFQAPEYFMMRCPRRLHPVKLT